MAEENTAKDLQIFCTDVYQLDTDDLELASELKLELWKKRAADPEGIYRSNMSGTWHSKDDVLETCGRAGEKLADIMFKAAMEYAGWFATHPGGNLEMKLSAWAMMYAKGGYATVHNHPNCQFSAVYYVAGGHESEEKVMATGDTITPGSIEFIDTRGAGMTSIKGLNFSPVARIVPKAGRLLVFPSWLPHFVHPVDTDDRISIACNIRILKYVLPKE